MHEAILDTPPLSQLFSIYSPEELAACMRSSVSLANEVYDLTTASGQRYVMKVLKSQTAETAEYEAVMQAKLALKGITTARYIELPNSRFVGESSGFRFTLSQHLEGQAPTTASLGLVTDMGATLAKIHDSLAGSEVPPSRMQLFDPTNAEGRLRYYAGSHRNQITAQVSRHGQLFSLDLPQTVIHGDLWLGNIFADEDRVTAVFDLETAERTCRILDLARTYLSLRVDTSFQPQTLFDRLIEGYDSSASDPITPEEHRSWKLSIAYVAGVCATWQALQGMNTAEAYLGFGETAA